MDEITVLCREFVQLLIDRIEPRVGLDGNYDDDDVVRSHSDELYLNRLRQILDPVGSVYRRIRLDDDRLYKKCTQLCDAFAMADVGELNSLQAANEACEKLTNLLKQVDERRLFPRLSKIVDCIFPDGKMAASWQSDDNDDKDLIDLSSVRSCSSSFYNEQDELRRLVYAELSELVAQSALSAEFPYRDLCARAMSIVEYFQPALPCRCRASLVRYLRNIRDVVRSLEGDYDSETLADFLKDHTDDIYGRLKRDAMHDDDDGIMALIGPEMKYLASTTAQKCGRFVAIYWRRLSWELNKKWQACRHFFTHYWSFCANGCCKLSGSALILLVGILEIVAFIVCL